MSKRATTPTTAATTTPKAQRSTITYDIERLDRGRWHGDIGESTGWPSIEAAQAAIDSLRQLGAEYLGDYRIVESGGARTIVATRQLAAEAEAMDPALKQLIDDAVIPALLNRLLKKGEGER